MQNERDVWNTSRLHRAIRKGIGETLLARYDLSEPLPNRMRALLAQLDGTRPIAGNRSGPPLALVARKCLRFRYVVATLCKFWI
jgi:hypothetical protein